LWRRQLCADDLSGLAEDFDRDEPCFLLEHDPVCGVAFARQHERGADIGVPGKGQFAHWGEDADMRGVRRVLRRQDEGGFRVIELARDGLHCGSVQPLRIEHHRQWIAAEWLVGEHVDGHVTALHHGSSLSVHRRART
jgi:hypothetical protein